MREQLAAVQGLKKAARELSEACLEYMSPPSNVVPMVRYYTGTVLDQPASADMWELLGRMP